MHFFQSSITGFSKNHVVLGVFFVKMSENEWVVGGCRQNECMARCFVEQSVHITMCHKQTLLVRENPSAIIKTFTEFC